MKATAAGLLLVLAVGCSPGSKTPQEDGLATSPSEPRATPRAEQVCRQPERPDLQGGDHLIGDREPPVPYSSTPPTSGWHSSGAFEIAVQRPDDPLTEPEQVSVLEAGGVVVTYNDLPERDRAALEQRVARRYAGRVATTAYKELGAGDVAFSGWAVLQRCDGLDLDALDRFVAKHADKRPAEPGER